MYLDNKYTKWYNNIIYKCKNRLNPNFYTEKHHIIPQSLGGPNTNDNIVNLTPKEHYIVHHLLTKMVEGLNKQKMVYAYWRMSTSKGTKCTSSQYDYSRKIFIESLKYMWMDPNSIHNDPITRNKRIQTTNSQEFIKLQSEMKKNKWSDPNSAYNSQEYRKKLSKAGLIRQNNPHVKESKSKFNKQMWKDGKFDSKKCNYMVTSPNGESFIIKGLKTFCRNNGLCSASMFAVCGGKISHHKGWKCQKL